VVTNGILTTIEPDDFVVKPGERVDALIKIKNVSNVVDAFTIVLEGLDSTWYELTPTAASAMPGEEVSCSLSLTPPNNSTAVAMTYPFSIGILSLKNPNQKSDTPAKIEVQPYYTFGGSIRPQKVTGSSGEFTITIENSGNTNLIFDMEGSDPEEVCTYTFRPETPRLGPGDTQQLIATVEPPSRPLKGQPKSYRFTINAQPDVAEAGAPVSVYGELEVPPLLPKWAIPAAGAAAVALVGLIALIVILVMSGGDDVVVTNVLLNPLERKFATLQLPDDSPRRINLSVTWVGTAEALNLSLVRPNGSRTVPSTVTPDSPNLSFNVNDTESLQSIEGWRIEFVNISQSGQADIVAKWELTDLQ